MRGLIARACLVALLGILAGCSKKTESKPPEGVPLVPGNERSRAFAEVNQHLELGGTLYGYMDIDGDGMKFASMMQSVVRQMPPTLPWVKTAAGLDYRAIFTTLGLNDITALGISSVPDASGGFRNRAFFYTPAGRHGLMAAFGGPAAPFVRTRMAPVDADWYAESEFDIPAAYAAVKALVARVSGQPAADGLDDQLKLVGLQAGFSLLELINDLKGRVIVIGHLEPDKTYALPGRDGLAIPRFSLMVCVEGIGGPIEQILVKSAKFTRTDAASRHYYALKDPLPVQGLEMAAMVEGSAFYLATSPEFLNECLDRKAGLDQNPEFQRLLASLGPEGNALDYVSPRFFAQLARLSEMNPRAPEAFRRNLALFAQQIPPADRPLMMVRSNLPEGILIRARYNRSFKRELILPAIYNPVTIGLVAALAVMQRGQAAAAAPFSPNFGMPFAPGGSSPQPGGDHPPVPLIQARPQYPADLRQRDVDAIVMVNFVVDPLGLTKNIRVTMSPDPEFSDAAVAAVDRWRFQPGRKGGRAVATRMEVPLKFTMRSEATTYASLDMVSNYYRALQREWRSGAAGPAGAAAPTLAPNPAGGLIWVRISADPEGHPAIEDVGHGPHDPGANRLRRVVEESLGGLDSAGAVANYLRKVGYIDIGFPRFGGPPKASVPPGAADHP